MTSLAEVIQKLSANLGHISGKGVFTVDQPNEIVACLMSAVAANWYLGIKFMRKTLCPCVFGL